MAKLDYERPKFSWERVHPDKLEENIATKFPDVETTLPAKRTMNRLGHKWLFYYATKDKKKFIYISAKLQNYKYSGLEGDRKVFKLVAAFYIPHLGVFNQFKDKEVPPVEFALDKEDDIETFVILQDYAERYDDK